MWLMIFTAIMKFAQGCIGPIMAFESKKADDILAGAQSGMAADNATQKIVLDYETAAAHEQAQASAWWGPRLITFLFLLLTFIILFFLTVDYLAHMGWNFGQPTGVLGLMVTMSLSYCFLHTSSALPQAAALTSWLKAKAGLLSRLTGK